MSLKTKKRFKNLGKIIGIGLFTLLMLTNIKLAMLDDNEIASGDISLFGIELNLFEAFYACGGGGGQSFSCSTAATCESPYTGSFTISCSASGSSVECIGADYSYVQCRAWYSNGTLKSYSYIPCP